VVAQHHGDIAVRSAPGDTVFTVRLPIAGIAETTHDTTVGARAAAARDDGRVEDTH
jgi:hypothetical protein